MFFEAPTFSSDQRKKEEEKEESSSSALPQEQVEPHLTHTPDHSEVVPPPNPHYEQPGTQGGLEPISIFVVRNHFEEESGEVSLRRRGRTAGRQGLRTADRRRQSANAYGVKIEGVRNVSLVGKTRRP